jgi:hypothetical protein
MNGKLANLLSLALALGVASCADQIACPVSVDSYCANTAVPECRYRNYEEALWEWNQQAEGGAPGLVPWGCDQCGDYEILSVEEISSHRSTMRYFSRRTGQLVAILQGASVTASTCVAGPPLFTLPSCSGTSGRCGYGTAPDGAIDGP